MSRLFYHVMQDNVGNLLFDVSGTMRLAGTGTAATIYGNEALSVILPNPMTNHPSFGSFKCYLGPGTYDFYMAKGGYTFETLTGLPGGGSMANQDASAVTMTTLGLNTAANANRILNLRHDKSGHYGIWVQPVDDAGALTAMVFANAAGTAVGSIATTGAATTYNTTSDGRLKEGVSPLTGAIDVLRALNPVAFRWRVDGSPGHGFLAHEVQAVVPEAVTGLRDAVDETGQMVPQGMDHSKLVPWLVSAVKELTQQVEMLTAKLAAAGG